MHLFSFENEEDKDTGINKCKLLITKKIILK